MDQQQDVRADSGLKQGRDAETLPLAPTCFHAGHVQTAGGS